MNALPTMSTPISTPIVREVPEYKLKIRGKNEWHQGLSFKLICKTGSDIDDLENIVKPGLKNLCLIDKISNEGEYSLTATPTVGALRQGKSLAKVIEIFHETLLNFFESCSKSTPRTRSSLESYHFSYRYLVSVYIKDYRELVFFEKIPDFTIVHLENNAWSFCTEDSKSWIELRCLLSWNLNNICRVLGSFTSRTISVCLVEGVDAMDAEKMFTSLKMPENAAKFFNLDFSKDEKNKISSK